MMADESINLPHGFRFNPFEEELISFYLKPKVLGQKLSSNVVEERQLYGPNADPWQLFHPEHHPWILSEVTPGRFEKVTYAFVNLTKKAAVDRKNKAAAARDNYIKKAGCGTWDAQTKRCQITDRITGDLIGEKRFLVFQINDDSHLDLSKVGYWKMHEFHLCGVNANVINPNNTVLCKITLDYSKNPPINLNSKKDRDHPVTSTSKQKNKNKDTNRDSVSLPSAINTNGEAVTTQIIELCHGEECIISNRVEHNTLLTANSPSQQLDTAYQKPVSSDFCWPAYGDDYKKFNKEERSVEDTTNLAKRKLKVETSCAMTKTLKPVCSDFCWLDKHDNQKIIKEAGGRGDLHSATNLENKKLKVETSRVMTKKFWPLTLIID